MSPSPQNERGAENGDKGAALRSRLVGAAEQLIQERPLVSITARDIARAADVSGGVLYNYFASKNDLLAAALARRHSLLAARIDEILPPPGAATIEENLTAFCRGVLKMHREMLPLATELHTDPDLFRKFIGAIHREPFGPRQVRRPIVSYLREEQQLGRIDPDADAGAVATLLLGSTFMLAMHSQMGAGKPGAGQSLPAIVRTLIRGLAPQTGQT